MKTVFLAGPVIFRTREPDPDGVQPVDHLGQPAKNRDGSEAKPFKIVERHLTRGANVVPNEVADHPYIQAHAIAAPVGASGDFTIEQLETMLAEKRAALLAGKKDDKPVSAAAKKGADDKDPIPMPDEDVIRVMSPKELRGLITSSGGSVQGVKDADLVAAALNLKAAQATA